ncbi:response regulator transcription factor [Paenibacillus taichungensis]|uniref:Transcriptional regulator n=1 Tax=Paenibacillus xylanivorans TaxID=1705561 RepID=A0A0M9BNV4_9BACL|nr:MULTISPECIES: response regulator transcription factor [Paenibacillus]KOY15102.1 transcriptional regulator [Paenibacillus xylanivorans]MEC0106076.1 response regulator transcription factor [Paenibacillus taichungensis]MEC0196765.1 response regulator transcription factor [Paenibacillus taichungensis]NEU59523.1 response regulator transcription factor [Paenibacillus sp. ALJ109b]QLG41043.1 response regulator transcription factor [Paenibacillus sp. E222]
MYTIMIIEDDPKIAGLLQSHIERYGDRAVAVEDFEQVVQQFEQIKPHVVLLDINLPSYDGFYWCRQIRSISTCPIIFISARSGKMDQVMALENGADDYITKPFEHEIVMAKIRSQLRRVYGDYAARHEERKVELDGLTVYLERLEMELGDRKIQLTKKETILLETLLRRSPKLVSRETILEKLWDDSFVDDNTLSVNVTRVRKRLTELGITDALETVRGSGYRLNSNWKASSPS